MDKGYKINNIDNTIIIEEPKMKPYIKLMQKKLSSIFNIEENRISIKAKTMEKMDSIGEKQAVAVYSTVLLIKG